MDTPAAADISLFEGFRLDRRAGVLARRDQQGVFTPIAIGRRALDLLGVLVERPGDLVSRDEIIEAVWPGTTVEDSNLNVQVAALRRIIDDGRAEGSCIQTVSGRGYRFVAPVTRGEPAAPPVPLPRSGNGSSGGSIAQNVRPHGPGTPGQLGGTLPAAASGDRDRLWRGIMATVIGALSLIAAVVTALNWHSPGSGEAHPGPRLSIVVLPFANLNNDPEQQYFADAVTEDLTTNLSRISGSFVISRNTAFTYRNKPVDAKQIGRELGVRYVLEGSVRRSGNQLRVNAQLIDAETDAHLWAERFDRDTSDLFALQDEITSRIAVAVDGELVRAEAARPTANPDALDYMLRGRAAYSKPASRENYTEAVSLFEKALALDPSSVAVQPWLASTFVGRVLNGMSDDPTSDLQHADEAIARTLAVWPNNARAHFAEGQVRRAQSRYEEAIPEYERAIALDHNFAAAYAYLGTCKLATGSIDEVIPNEEQAIRLNPRDWNLGGWYFTIGAVHLLKGQIDEAILWLEKSRSANAGFHRTRASLAAAYALKGDTQHAAAELAEARRLNDRYSSIARLKAAPGYQVLEAPKIRALAEATYFAGLRKAGMPEE
jgi:TolB-like protein/DNA-binding winged helix-turn-helix (wHTH) protein/Tfp pilus assembly protein PilF